MLNRVVALIFLSLALCLPAGAQTLRLDAELAADLQTITGTIHVVGGPLDDADRLRLVDALSRVEQPTDDLTERRTFPGVAQQGWVHIEPTGAGRWRFHTILPRRYGANGFVPGHGLFVNGLWHPHPVRGALPAVVDWDVSLALPDGVTGVLNGVVSERHLHWQGRADRLSLAAVPGARVDRIDLPAGRLVLVDHGPVDRRRSQRLRDVVVAGWSGPRPPDLVVVDTPSRRRLARPGRGVLYLSDRAFRLSGPLWQYHRAAVREGVLAAALPVEGTWLRGFAAASLAPVSDADPDPSDLLGWVSFIPEIDSILYDGQLPFHSDVFSEAWPGDPLRDDPDEVLAPSTPPRVAARRLDLQFGDGTAARLSWMLLGGQTLADAAAAVGIPPAQLARWRLPPVTEALSATAHRDGDAWTISLQRDTSPSAPAQAIPYEIDGKRWTWNAPAGTSTHTVRLPERPDHVRVDPDGLSDQVARADDAWPQRWGAVVSAWPYEMNLTNRSVSGVLQVAIRRQYGSRWVWVASASREAETIAGFAATAVRYLGPLTDRRHRALRLWVGGGPDLLDPRFRPTGDRTVAWGATAGIRWDDRVDAWYPRSGMRHSLSFSGGFVPSEANWGSIRHSSVLLRPVGGRGVMAMRAGVAVARGGVSHRLLSLGGQGLVEGVPPEAVVGEQRATAGAELRWQVVRNASLRLPLTWLSHIQMTSGVDVGALPGVNDLAGAGCGDTCDASAASASVGLLVTGENLGARPGLVGITAARPLWASDPSLTAENIPVQWALRLSQSF